MFQFNPDGSIKLPEKFAKQKQELQDRMNNTRCITVNREIISTWSPKKCKLNIKLSGFVNPDMIDNAYRFFREQSQTPMKLNKLNSLEYNLEIGTDFKRCSDCNAFISRLRNTLNGHVIDNLGTCTFKRKEFSYEDHFE